MKLPSGFKLEDSGSPELPKLPSGFTLDNAPAGEDNSGTDYWSETGKSALEEAKAIPGGIWEAAKTISPPTLPVIGKSIFQAAKGTPLMETPVGEHAQKQMEFVKGVPGAIWQGVKDTGKFGMMPVEMATGTPPSKTMFGEEFRKRPLGMAAGVASTVVPIFKAGRAAFATEGPNILERTGARGMMNEAGIKPKSVGKMTKGGANPVDVGGEAGTQFANEGVIGKGAKVNFDNFKKMEKLHGASVGKALGDIKEAAQAQSAPWMTGRAEVPSAFDPLKVEAVPTLKPILDEANNILKAGYDTETGNLMKRMYSNLQEKANASEGYLSLDHIDDELGKVGELFGTAARNTDKFEQAAKLYGRLADIRDQIITSIADKAGDESLRQNLLNANANYSRYMRIKPDIRHAAEVASVKNPGEIFKHPLAIPGEIASKYYSKGMYKAGRGMRRIFEPMKGDVRNQKGAIFPEGSPIPKERNLIREFGEVTPDSRKQYLLNLKNAEEHARNYDWQAVLRDKWALHKHQGGN